MTSADASSTLLRADGEDARRVTFIELFFDLVYVFAVTQLAHLLGAHLTALGAAQTLLLLLAVWRAWIDTVWITNWFDPERGPVRVLLLVLMLLSLLMSAALPQAFGSRGFIFAAAYAAMHVMRPAFAVANLGSDPGLRRNFQRILVWCVASALLWLAGGIAEGTARELLWLGAVALDYAAPASGFFTPGLGRSRTTDWNIAGSHLAERFQLVLLIALGESILDTGATLGDLPWTAPRLASFVVAFVATVALWWIYFYRSAAGGSSVIAATSDPGRLGRSAYTYFHLPMVAGIIVAAVGNALTISQPEGHTVPATAMVVLGGPALFLAGHLLFKWTLAGRLYLSRIVGILALGAMAPLGVVLPPLALSACAAAVLVGVAGWETWSVWMQARSSQSAEAVTAPTVASTQTPQ